MSQRQGPPESEAAATLELLTLREEINNLDLSERRLKLQVIQLQSQIASYQAAPPRPADAPQTSDAPPRLAALRASLADTQDQLAQITAQKKALAERRLAAQKRLKTLHASFQRDATWQHAAPPWEKASQPTRKSSHKPLMVLLCGLLLVALLGSLIRIIHVSSLGLSLLNPYPSGAGRNIPPEQSPFFTPAKTAPTNQGCLTTIRDACYSPEYIQQAFGLTQLYQNGLDGRGQTIVLLGAGNTTTLKSDLHKFDVAWGLPDLTPTILYPDGPPTPYTCPGGSDSLEYQNTLDVEWAHAIAPGANITLVIGANNVSSTQPQANCVQTSLQHDLAYALDHALGNIISISAGSSELGSAADTAAQKAGAQKYFAAGHALLQRAASAGITVLAATGNSGATNLSDPSANTYWLTPNVSWPASDPDALAVGGTLLTLGNDDYDDAYASETTWNNPSAGATGGGLSSIFAEPDYQKIVPNQTLLQGKRGIPDVAFPAADLLVYASGQDGALIKANPQWRHWDVADGTGLATPCWAGLIAIANQMGGKPLGLIQPALYRLQGQDMHDITSGDNTFASVPGYRAQKGYDLVTGWGTPIAKDFLPTLLQATNTAVTRCGAQGSARPNGPDTALC